MFDKILNARKRWFVILATAALLLVGLTGGAVFATDHTTGSGLGFDGRILARVAEIVGIAPEVLQDAFDTAVSEAVDERFSNKMDQLVADGTLTQDQAEEAMDWFASRPTRSETGNGRGILAATLATDNERVERLMNLMVDAGTITREQADALIAWHSERPDFLPGYSGEHGVGRGHRR